MQKNLTPAHLWLTMMRITAIQIGITILLTGIAWAGEAQELLSRRISIPEKAVEARSAITEISKLANVKISYNSKLISKGSIVRLYADNETVNQVLSRTLGPLNVSFILVDHQIILRKTEASVKSPDAGPAGNDGRENVSERTVNGTVTDKRGEPLPGVSILVKGSQIGTATDANGVFSIRIPDGDALLVFSSVGYLSQEVVVGNRTSLAVSLVEDEKALQEVVVVGYGTQKRSDITGAVTSVNVKELEGVPLRSVDQALQGRVAGVFMTQGGGQPGAGNSIRIRGGNSINGSNEPLYVIDGIPVYVAPTDGASGNLNPLNSISPNDIASIEVLKDASAAAIYGARGGNGVILITTKRGKVGESRIDFDLSYGFQKELKRYELLNAKQYEQLANDASVAEGGPLLFDPNGNPESTDWQDLLYRSTTPIQDYRLSISGGDQKTQYLLSLGYFNQIGVLKPSDMERYSVRLNLDRQVKERVKVGSNLTFSSVGANKTVTTSVITAPNLPLRQPDGSFTSFDRFGSGFNNPAVLIRDAKDFNKVFRGLGNVYATVELMKGLNFKTMWGLDINFAKNDAYTPQTVYAGSISGGDASVNTSQTFTWLNENTLDYTHTFGRHRLNLLAGYTQQSSRAESLGARATGFLNDNTGSNNLGLGNPGRAVLPSSSTAGWGILSWLGRANYGFKDRYLLTVTGRYDGSSRFGSNNRWGFFPSAAVAWRVIEEDFMKNLRNVSDLKLRLSHGVTGNQDGIGNYPALDLWGAANYVLNNAVATGLTPTQLSNQNLKWESTAATDLGLELGLLNNRLTFTADVYYKKTSNLLLTVSVPATSGFISGTKNIGSVENKGVEFTINAVPLEKAVTWNSGFNIAFNRNKILNLGMNDELIPATDKKSALLKVGEPLGNFYGYVSPGLFQTEQEVKESAQPLAKPGDVKFIDFNNDRVINAIDRRVLGNAQPKFYGGWNNTFTYKGAELSFFLQYVYGNSLFNENKHSLENMLGEYNQSVTVLNRWTPENRTTVIPRATTTKPTYDPYTHYVEDGSYLRLKNIRVSYDIPGLRGKFLGIQTIKAYATIQNVLTFTRYSGLDPEVNRYGSNNVLQGYDNSPYPNVRTTTFGINLGF